MAEKGVMELADVRSAIAWQADHAAAGGAPCTARVVRAELAILETDTATGRRMANWHGLTLADAMPLRIAGALHWLYLSGEERRLEPVYAGLMTDQKAIDRLVADIAVKNDALLMAWLDGPPQTNEAGRSASIMAGLLWLSVRLGPKFELSEIGASAGINTMMGRYFYDLGGVTAGPSLSRMKIVPEWRGPPPPRAEVDIVGIEGCDVAPVDLTDPAQALRLRAFVWADARERMRRLDTAIAMAERMPPELVKMDAGDFVRQRLARPQEAGVTRVLFHSIVWQYVPEPTRAEITAMMERAGAEASADKPLAWIMLETNRETFKHELVVRYWPGGAEPVKLAEAHPHGAWVQWLAEG
jgi:hypothetical protein